MQPFPVIDGDGHVYESDAELIKYFEGPHAIRKRNSALSLFPSLDGWQRGVMHERDDKNPNRPFHTDAGIWSKALAKNRTEAIAIAARVGKQPASKFAGWLFTHRDYYHDRDGLPNLDALQSNVALLHELGFLKRDLPVRSYADLSIAEAAAKRLN